MATALSSFPWAAALIVLPLLGALICFLWPVVARVVGLITVSVVAVSVAGLAWLLLNGGAYRHAVGGWGAPLGVDLYVDGLTLVMLSMTAAVGLAVSVYSSSYFKPSVAVHFWPLWLSLLAALNALFLSADIFNLYVTLELVGLSAVALSALSGSKAALAGAMRYLLATLLGSLAYLFGVALLYHGFGSVDIVTLGQRVEASPIVWVAFALMVGGLLLKMALFPLHFWLPSAHASAPAAVSALLSALVVKGSFYIALRVWTQVFGPLGLTGVEMLLGVLGAFAVLWGSLQALRQTRLKLLVAYSTVAQIGYFFIAFPLAGNDITVWNGVLYLALSHALAKSAMFMVAGNILKFSNHDRIADLDSVAQRLPLTIAAFALAGVSIIGLPPSGGFVGKWMLLDAALTQDRWDLVIVMLLGGLLAAAYVFKVLGYAFTQARVSYQTDPVPATMQWAAFVPAVVVILLGFLAVPVLSLLEIGLPFSVSEVRP